MDVFRLLVVAPGGQVQTGSADMKKYGIMIGVMLVALTVLRVLSSRDAPVMSAAEDAGGAEKELAATPIATMPAPPTENSGAGNEANPAAPAQAMRSQLQQIEQAYVDNARFPLYSKPLQSNDWEQLHPRAFVPSERPLANAPSIKVSVELPHYIVDHNADLPVTVIVFSGPSGGAPVSVDGGQVEVRSGDLGTSPVALAPVQQQGSVDTFAAVIPAAALTQFEDADIQVLARLQLSDGQQSTGWR